MGVQDSRVRVLEWLHVRYPRAYRVLRALWRFLRWRFRDYPRYRRKLVRFAETAPCVGKSMLRVHVVCLVESPLTARGRRRFRTSVLQQQGVELRLSWLVQPSLLNDFAPLANHEEVISMTSPPWPQLSHWAHTADTDEMLVVCRSHVRFLPDALRRIAAGMRAVAPAALVFGDHEYVQRGRLCLSARTAFDRHVRSDYAIAAPFLAFNVRWLAEQGIGLVNPEAPSWTSLLADLLGHVPECSAVHLPLPVVRVEDAQPPSHPALDRSGALPSHLDMEEAGNSLPMIEGADIAVIIPTRDGYPYLRAAVDTAMAALQACRRRGRIVIIDNQSAQPATCDYLHAVADTELHGVRLEVWRYDHPFNYARMHNWAVAQLREPLLLLLNDDVEASQSGLATPTTCWLAWMLAQMRDPRVAAVGAQLRYPNGTVQHAGVVLGLGIDHIAGHVGVGLDPGNDRLAMAGLGRPRAVSAVTAACLLTRRESFEQVGGFESEGLPVAFNDVDYCLRLRASGYDVVMEPRAVLTHHESLTRGQDHDPVKRARFEGECAFMKRRWGRALLEDPFYSPHYAIDTADLSLRAQPDGRAVAARVANRAQPLD